MDRTLFYICVYLILIILSIIQILLFYNMSGKKAAIKISIYELFVITAYTMIIIVIF